MRAVLVAIALLCFVTPSLAQGPASGFYEQGGVQYFASVGALGSGHLSNGHDYDGDDQLPFYGCAIGKVRPDKDLGRIRVISNIGYTPVQIEFVEYDAPRKDMQGGIAVDLPVDGSRTHGTIEHPAVHTEIAAWGKAIIDLAGFIYPDPTNDNPEYAATFFVTSEGFRNDETDQVLNHDGTLYEPGRRAIRNQGEYEMHLRLESLPGTNATGTMDSVQAPPQTLGGNGGNLPVGLPIDYLAPTPDYRQVYTFLNDRFGGNGTLDVRASAMLGLGTGNDVDFIMRDPDGVILDTINIAPPAGSETTGSIQFPLERFGYYTIEVAGSVNYLEYSFDFIQLPPETFDFHFWWNNVTLGFDSRAAQEDCQNTLQGTSEESQGAILPRDPPNKWPMVAVVVTTISVFCAVLIGIVFVVLNRADYARKRLLG